MFKFLLKISIFLAVFINISIASQTKSEDLIIIAAPTIIDTYDDKEFENMFYDIIDFDIKYANEIYGNDKVFIIVDQKTKDTSKVKSQQRSY